MIKIIDYKAGNAPSVMHAVEYVGRDAAFAHGADDLADASHIILPGVGSAGATMRSLSEMGLVEALEDAVLKRRVPFLGICVGMQILFEHSEEEDVKCLGWLKGRVVKFDVSKVRVPQMGWNKVRFVKDALNSSPADVRPIEDFFYFVNSYHARPSDPSDLWGESDYDGAFAAAVSRDNIFGTQFHAEKSGEAGLSLLKKFFKL